MKLKSLVCWSLGAIALLSVGGPTIYLHHQLTQIPPTLKKTPEIAKRFQRHHVLHREAFATVRKIASGSDRSDQGRIARLNTSDLNAFFAYSLALSFEQHHDPPVLLGTNVEIFEDTVKTTALIDLSQVSESSLEIGGRLSLLRRVLKIPGVSDRPIAIAVEGRPIVRDRVLAFDNPVITIGNIRLTTVEAVQWLGISEAILRERLDREWGGLPIDLDRVQIQMNGPDNEDSTPYLQLEGGLTAW